MYNKLFTKILDSSIWLEPDHIRLVWITFLAVMDQDGIVALSGIGNVANRARITEELAASAIECLESPDTKNPDQEYEGRRVERIPGVGWFVLNAEKYREIMKAEDARAKTRERVRRYRNKVGNADVTLGNDSVTLSETETEADTEKKKKKRRSPKSLEEIITDLSGEPAYAHINVPHEAQRAEVWIKNHPGRKFTQAFLIGWLNKIEAPLVNTTGHKNNGCEICLGSEYVKRMSLRPGEVYDKARNVVTKCVCVK